MILCTREIQSRTIEIEGQFPSVPRNYESCYIIDGVPLHAGI